MADYNGSKYFSDQPVPTCSEPGVVRCHVDTVSITTALTTSDVVKLARMPANHRVIAITIGSTDMDSGTTITWNIGTTANDGAFAAALVMGQAAANLVHQLPLAGATSGLLTFFTDAVPSTDYDVLAELAAGPATTTGTVYVHIWYTADYGVRDPTNSPAVVTS